MSTNVHTELMYEGRRYRLRKAAPKKQVHFYVHWATHVVGYYDEHTATQELAPAVNADLLAEGVVEDKKGNKVETRRLFVDNDDGSFFAEMDVSLSSGSRFDKFYAELSSHDALAFFFNIKDLGGLVDENRARKIWGNKFPIHALVHQRTGWEKEELDPKADLEAKQRQEKLTYIDGDFCAPPYFKVMDWKYDVPQWVAETYVELLEEQLRKEFPDVSSENVEIDLHLQHLDEKSLTCWGMVIPRNINQVEIRGDDRVKVEEVVRKVWHTVYDAYLVQKREEDKKQDVAPEKKLQANVLVRGNGNPPPQELRKVLVDNLAAIPLNWFKQDIGYDHILTARIPRSRAKGVYNKICSVLRKALKDSGLGYQEHPSSGDLLEDESASTQFKSDDADNEVLVYAEKEIDGDGFEIAVNLSF